MPFIGTFTHNRRKAEYKPSGGVHVDGSEAATDATTGVNIDVPRGTRMLSAYAVGAGGGGGASNTQYTYNSQTQSTTFVPGANDGGNAGGGGGVAAANRIAVKYGDSVYAQAAGPSAGGQRNIYTYAPNGFPYLEPANAYPGVGSTGGTSKLTVAGTDVVRAFGGTGGLRGVNSSSPGGGGAVTTSALHYPYANNTTYWEQTGGLGYISQNSGFTKPGGGSAAGILSPGADGMYYYGPTNTSPDSLYAVFANYIDTDQYLFNNDVTDAKPTAGGTAVLGATGAGISINAMNGIPVTTPSTDLNAVHGRITLVANPSTPAYGSQTTTTNGSAWNSPHPGASYGGGGGGQRGREDLRDGTPGEAGAITVKWGMGVDARYSNIAQPATFSQGAFNNLAYDSDGVTLLPFSTSVSSPNTPVDEGFSKTYTINTINPPSPSATFYYTMQLVDSDGNATAAPSAELTPVSGAVTLSLGQATKTIEVVEDETTEPLHEFMRMQIRENSVNGTVLATSNQVRINDTSLSPIPIPQGSAILYSTTQSSWSVPADDGIEQIHVKLVGGGGAGGRGYAVAPTRRSSGGGGGGGGVAVVEGIPVSPGDTLTYRAGRGGERDPGSNPGDGDPSYITFTSSPSPFTIMAGGASGATNTGYSASTGGAGGSSYTLAPAGNYSNQFFHYGGSGGSGQYASFTPSATSLNAGGGGGVGGDRSRYSDGTVITGQTGAPGLQWNNNAVTSTFDGTGGGGGGGMRGWASGPFAYSYSYSSRSFGGDGGGMPTSVSPNGMNKVAGWRSFTNDPSPTVFVSSFASPSTNTSRLNGANTEAMDRGKDYGGGGRGGGGTPSGGLGNSGSQGVVIVRWGDDTWLDAGGPLAPTTVKNKNPGPGQFSY